MGKLKKYNTLCNNMDVCDVKYNVYFMSPDHKLIWVKAAEREVVQKAEVGA